MIAIAIFGALMLFSFRQVMIVCAGLMAAGLVIVRVFLWREPGHNAT